MKVTVYRLSKTKYAGDLSGEGARRAGGRLNERGRPAVYTSESIALAQLEMLVHVGQREDLPEDYSVTVIEVDLDMGVLHSLPELPEPIEESQRLGQSLLNDPAVLGFWAPSVIISRERNLILNPGFARFSDAVQVVEIFRQPVDPRLRQ